MDSFKKGKFEHCLEEINERMKTSSTSVSTQLLLKNDSLVCHYMLGQKNAQGINEDLKHLLLKSASLPPSEESCRAELTLLHNFIYTDLLTDRNQCSKSEQMSAYTQAAKVLFRVYSVIQPFSISELRNDLPTDVEACCYMLVHRCLCGIPFTADVYMLVPLCHVIGLLAVIEFRRGDWKEAIKLLSSSLTAMKKLCDNNMDSTSDGFLLPMSLDDSTENRTSCPLDWLKFLMGLAYFQLKQWKQSREILQAVKEDWLLPFVSYFTGLCLLKEGESIEAVTVVGQRIKTKHMSVRLKAKMFNLLGDCFGKLNKPQLSLQMYKEALSVDFGYLLPLYNISLQYQQLGTRDVELECLNLLVTSLESDVRRALPTEPKKRFISVLDHITTDDSNISYPVAVYRLALRCLQLERFDIASQKYQDLIAFLKDCWSGLQHDAILESGFLSIGQFIHLAINNCFHPSLHSNISQTHGLPSLRQIHHEAIFSLLQTGKYSDCLELCNRAIVSYQKDQGHYLSADISVDNSQMSDVEESKTLIGSHNTNDNDSLNNNPSAARNSVTLDKQVNNTQTDQQSLKRKRQESDSDSGTHITCAMICTSENEISGQTVSCDDNSARLKWNHSGEVSRLTVSCESSDTLKWNQSSEFDRLDRDVVAMKYKADILDKLGEVDAAIDCLESAVNSISSYRKTTLQRNIENSLDSSIDIDKPATKRQRINIHGDTCHKSKHKTHASDILIEFEAELYQSLGTILCSREQYPGAVHYYRLAAQLLPDSTKINYLCSKTLLSMKCPKKASSNWLTHRKLPHISSFQISTEIARKQQSLRSLTDGEISEEKDYTEMDLQCLTFQQQFLQQKK